ncbi:MAG: ATP-binding protein [Deltaproteobacteria bacterium]|nr:ATP-binding protein [Deltaproteobacteria bacterium]
MISRRIEDFIQTDLKKKMVFLSGPRQCGKTTLAKDLLKVFPSGQYYNWDIGRDRKLILKNEFNLDSQVWILDEIHKFRKWRNFLKGLYDEHSENHSILVTGSARLNLYGRGGDSLQGRYFAHHLHPLTLSEVLKTKFSNLDSVIQFPHEVKIEAVETLEHLLIHGGFPEPFLEKSLSEVKRWQLLYSERLIEEELRSLEQVREIEQIELLLDRLDDIAGSIISLNSLREDLDVSFDSVRKWLIIFEKIYACFRISPFGPPRIKAVKKEQKLYLWDWARVKSDGARFENLIAVHLLRLIDYARDVYGEKCELRYFRHRDGSEVDFLLLRNHKPWMAIEVKLEEQELSRSLRYLAERVEIPHIFQIYLKGKHEKTLAKIGNTPIRSISAPRFLLQLP